MSADAPSTVIDATHGFRRLASPPSAEETASLYSREYHGPESAVRRAPDVRRLASRGEESERERTWLEQTLYADVADWLEAHAPGRRVLDVGCGAGDLLAHLRARGFEVCGIEPSEQASGAARAAGLDVRCGFLDDLERGSQFDAIVMLNVLEHFADAERALRACRERLAAGGVLIIRAPNDFSELQEAAERTTQRKHWWVVSPDHTHYFNFASLRSLLSGTGFEVLEERGDFPMELFLLMGENYVDDPQLGAVCHRWRVRMELAMPREMRRQLYAAMAAIGVGRNCVVVARREPT